MTLTRTVDLIELLWSLFAAAGVLLALDGLGYALADRRIVKRAAARPRSATERRRDDARAAELELALVNGDVASARWILFVESLLLLTGIGAMTYPSPAGGRSPAAWLTIVLLMAAAAGLPAWLYGKRRRRRQLLDADRPAA